MRQEQPLIRGDRPGSDDRGNGPSTGGRDVHGPAVGPWRQRRADKVGAAVGPRDTLGRDLCPELQVAAKVVGSEHDRTRGQHPEAPQDAGPAEPRVLVHLRGQDRPTDDSSAGHRRDVHGFGAEASLKCLARPLTVVATDDHHTAAHHARLQDGIGHLCPLQRIDDQGQAVVKGLRGAETLHGCRQQRAIPGLDRQGCCGARHPATTAACAELGEAACERSLRGGLTVEERGQAGMRGGGHARYAPLPQALKHSNSNDG